MTTDALEEELQVLSSFFDEFCTEAVTGEILESVLVGEGSDYASGEITFETLAKECEVVETSTGGHVGSGEMREVGFCTDAVADEGIFLTFEFFTGFEDLDHQIACPGEGGRIVGGFDIASESGSSGGRGLREACDGIGIGCEGRGGENRLRVGGSVTILPCDRSECVFFSVHFGCT